MGGRRRRPRVAGGFARRDALFERRSGIGRGESGSRSRRGSFEDRRASAPGDGRRDRVEETGNRERAGRQRPALSELVRCYCAAPMKTAEPSKRVHFKEAEDVEG